MSNADKVAGNEAVREFVAGKTSVTAADAVAHVKQATGIEFAPTTISSFLKNAGFEIADRAQRNGSRIYAARKHE